MENIIISYPSKFDFYNSVVWVTHFPKHIYFSQKCAAAVYHVNRREAANNNLSLQ